MPRIKCVTTGTRARAVKQKQPYNKGVAPEGTCPQLYNTSLKTWASSMMWSPIILFFAAATTAAFSPSSYHQNNVAIRGGSRTSSSYPLFMNKKKKKSTNDNKPNNSKGFGSSGGGGFSSDTATTLIKPKTTSNFQYAGTIRPGLQSPKRIVPSEKIVFPDYALDGVPKNRPALFPWVIEVKKADEIEKMRLAGRCAREVLDLAGRAVKPGITT